MIALTFDRIRPRFPLPVAVSFIATLSCSSSATITGRYVYHSDSELDCLTVTQDHQKLTGFVQNVSANLSAAQGYEVKQLRFVGEIDGSSFTLHAEALERFFGSGLSDCS